MKKWLITMLGLTLVLALVAVGCSGGDDDNGGLSASALTQLGAEALVASGGLVGGTGINVTGVGEATIEPDLAVLSLGVEAFSETVAEARDTAAVAMNGIIALLRDQGVEDRDIQTQFFNIRPEYTFDQVIVEPISIGAPEPAVSHTEPAPPAMEPTPIGAPQLEVPRMEPSPPQVETKIITRSERRLVGYRVTNTLTVTVRDLDSVGAIIDGAVQAGGDAVRVNSIRFTVENGKPHEEAALTAAIQDAMAKARLFADTTGVTLGKLVFISESSGPQFPVAVARLEAAPAADFGSTPVQPGELKIRVMIQAMFAID